MSIFVTSDEQKVRAYEIAAEMKRGLSAHFISSCVEQDVMGFKNALRKIVDRHGGIGKLAEKSGIPQPSLKSCAVDTARLLAEKQ